MSKQLVVGIGTIALGVATGGATLVGGLLIAGGTLSTIGAVTGNKYASQWGGYLSMAGGIAGIGTAAANALTASTAAEAAASSNTAALAGTESVTPVAEGATAAETAATGVDAANAAATAAETTNAAGAAMSGGDALNQSGLLMSEMGGSPGLTEQLADASVKLADAPTVGTESSFAADTAARAAENAAKTQEYFKPLVQTDQPLVLDASQQAAPGELGSGTFNLDASQPSAAGGKLGSGTYGIDTTPGATPPKGFIESSWDSIKDAAKGYGDFVKQNKEAVQLGAGVLQGALTPNEKEIARARAAAQLKAQQEYDANKRALYNASVTNSLPSFSISKTKKA